MNPLTIFPHLILEISAAFDTGLHDETTPEEILDHIDAGDLFEWLEGQTKSAGDFDFSLLKEVDRLFVIDKLQDIKGGYSNGERKWGIKNRGLGLLISWLTTLNQHESRKLITAALEQAGGTVVVPYELVNTPGDPMVRGEVDRQAGVISYSLQ